MYFCLAREEKGLFDGHALSRITSLAVISFETSSTQTTISFVCKTSLTGCFVLARFLRTCVLWKKGTISMRLELYGRHLFPSAKLPFSFQWLSQDISHHFSYMNPTKPRICWQRMVDLNIYSNNPNPNPNPNPYFVCESLICQRQFGGSK